MPRTRVDPDLHEADLQAIRALLAADPPSRPLWQRQAVGTDPDTARAQIPTFGSFISQLPIVPFRAIQRHIARSERNQADWVRGAIVMRYLYEGGDPTVAEAAMAVKRDRRRRDVPHDHRGQPRRRSGRGGFDRLD